jgi:hypothetical protein
MTRLDDIRRLYTLLERLEAAVDGKRLLGDAATTCKPPPRGVYFFFEPGENRCDSGDGPRLVRIGTHALGAGAKSTLGQRLKQHRGLSTGGGNHRGSVFRLLVGEALLARGDCAACLSWGVKGDITKACAKLGISGDALRAAETPVERAVSEHLRRMPFLWLPIGDEPGPASLRGHIERNTIALISNWQKPPIDPPSGRWLGRSSGRGKVRLSGLWNQRHVEELYDPAFLDVLEKLVSGASLMSGSGSVLR